MPDVTDQLRAYRNRAVDEVEPVTPADALAASATGPETPPTCLHAERAGAASPVRISDEGEPIAPGARARGRATWLAVAAAIAVAALVAGALAIARGGDEAGLATEPGPVTTVPEPAATYDGSAPPDLVITAGDHRLEQDPNAGSGWYTDLGNGETLGEVGDAVAPQPENLETVTIPAGAGLRLTLPGPRWRVEVDLTQNGGGDCPIRYKQDLPRSDSGGFGVPTPLPVGEYMAVVTARLEEGGRVWGNGRYAFNVRTSETSPMPPRVAELWWSDGESVPGTITIWHPDALDDHPDGREADRTGDGTNIAIGTSDHDTSVGLEPSTTAECGRGVTWLQVPEEDRAALGEPDGDLFFGLDVRFADGLYASDRLAVPDGHLIAPLENVANNPSPPEPSSPLDTTTSAPASASAALDPDLDIAQFRTCTATGEAPYFSLDLPTGVSLRTDASYPWTPGQPVAEFYSDASDTQGISILIQEIRLPDQVESPLEDLEVRGRPGWLWVGTGVEADLANVLWAVGEGLGIDVQGRGVPVSDLVEVARSVDITAFISRHCPG